MSRLTIKMPNIKQISSNLPDMNTDAVLLVLEGKLEEAISLFNISLELCIELEKSGFLDVTREIEEPDEAVLSPISLDEVMQPSDQIIAASHINEFQLLRKIFVLENLDDIKCRTNLVTFASTVLFNLAALYQELFLVAGDMKWLSDSFRLYQALQELFLRASTVKSVIMLQMALYNNLGHMFAFLSDKEGVVEMRSNLMQKLATSSQQPDYFGLRNFFRRSLGVVCNHSLQLQSAPAA